MPMWLRAGTILAASGGSAALGLLASILLARTYGADALGLFATLIGAFALLSPLASLGLDRLLLRHFAREQPTAVFTLLGPGLLLVLSVAIIGAGLLALGGPILFDAEPHLYALGAMALVTATLWPLGRAVLQARHRDLAVAAWTLSVPLGRLGSILLALLLAGTFTFFMALFAALELLLAGVALILLIRVRNGMAPAAAGARPPLRPLLAGGIPFALSGALYTIYYQVDVLMLGALLDLEASGLYKAAAQFIAAAYLLPAAFIQHYLLPRIFRWREAGNAGPRILRTGLLALAFGMAAGAVLFIIADPLLRLTYGSAYAASIPALQGLALAIPFHCLAIAAGGFLVRGTDIRHKVVVQVLLALLNITLNACLIPAWGILGAVVATVITEIVLAAAYVLLILGSLRRESSHRARAVAAGR